MYFVVLALVVAVASKWPKEFFFVGAILYLVSGPLLRLWAIAFPSRHTPEELLTPAEVP
jgi:hypothetical protein